MDLILNTDDIIRTDLHTFKTPIPTWSTGRVTLLGDACHPTTPELGMGANMALEDAVMLAARLQESATVEEAFQKYEKLRKERCEKLVATAADVRISPSG